MKRLFTTLLIVSIVLGPYFYPERVHGATDIVNDATLSTSLVSCWELDEESGTRIDAVTASGNDLTDNNTVLFGTGVIDNAADFNAAASEYLSITDAAQTGLDFSGDMSVSLWVDLETAPSSAGVYFINKWDGAGNDAYLFDYFDASGTKRLRFIVNDGGGTENMQVDHTLSTTNFQHVIAVFDSSTGDTEYFVNGSSVGTGNSTATGIQNTAAAFGLGADPNNSGAAPLDGKMDIVAIWSKKLSAGEISSLYNSGNGIPCVSAGGGEEVNQSQWF